MKIWAWPAEHSNVILVCILAWLACIGAAEVIAQQTETKKDDEIIGKIRGASIFVIKLLIKPWKIDASKINFGK
jgi:hypothetical protein